MSREYDSERTTSREDAAAVLDGVADGLRAGSIRLGDGADAVAVDAPEEVELEVELEAEDGELSLELELEWPEPDGEDASIERADDLPEDERDGEVQEPERPVPVGAADASGTLARFELFEDAAGEWRWRLRHRNGNVIADSGEGYTRKRNAKNGLRSVVANAPGADVVEDSED